MMMGTNVNISNKGEIKAAYKKLALKHHPDKNLDDPDATARFQELSKAYLDLKPEIREIRRHHHQFFCPTHGYCSYSDSDYSDYDDDEYYSDDEILSEEEENLLFYFRKVFLDVFSEFVFRNRFFARKKKKKLSPEDEEEDQFFDFIHKKYREENEDEYELTEEDLRKFHSYDEWHKASSQRKRRSRKKGRAAKRKTDTVQQESTKPVTKKQQLAQQRKREQEMKKIGEELAKSVKTKSSNTNKKQNETQRGGCITQDEQVAEELRAQQERKRVEQERMKEKLKQLEAEEKKKEKQSKRKEKKSQRKQNKLTNFQRKPEKENQPEENIFLERLKDLHQSANHEIKEDRMVSENLRKASEKNEQEMKAKSSLIARHFGIQSSDPIHKPMSVQSASESSSSTSSSVSSEPAQKCSAELLKRHLEMYEEIMKVQPQRHTEQQIKIERSKLKEKLLQKQQQELERLRGEQRSELAKPATTSGVSAGNVFDDPASYQAKRSKLLQQQREQEKKRNEEEDFIVKTQRLYELKRKKPEPKWYEREKPKMPQNPKNRTEPEVWIPPPTPPVETVWAKRQKEQEQKQAALEEMLPSSEMEEQEMLKKALEISEREAREEETRKKLAKELTAKRIRSYDPSSNPPGHDRLPPHTCTMTQPNRPVSQEPYSSIWDIDDSKTEEGSVRSSPLPASHILQIQEPLSYARITKQSCKPVSSAVPYFSPSPTVSGRECARDTQMDLERAEMEDCNYTSELPKALGSSWNAGIAEKPEHYSAKSMPAYVPQTLETDFSVSGDSSDSLSSSVESLGEVQANAKQTQSFKPENIPTSLNRFDVVNNSKVHCENRFDNDKKEVCKIKLSGEVNTDHNNNTFLSNINLEAKRKGDLYHRQNTGMPMNNQKMLSDNQRHLETTTASETEKCESYEKPSDKKIDHPNVFVVGQRQSKPVDNLSKVGKLNLQSNSVPLQAVNTKPVNRGGFGKPKVKTNKMEQTEAVIKNFKSAKETVKQQNQAILSKPVATESENWDEEIEDFPPDIIQTYSYGIDHVNNLVRKNCVLTENELTEKHKNELHFKRTEPVSETFDLDVTPVDNAGYQYSEKDTQGHSSFSKTVTNSEIGPVDSDRRLPVLKDLTKLPEPKTRCQPSFKDKPTSVTISTDFNRLDNMQSVSNKMSCSGNPVSGVEIKNQAEMKAATNELKCAGKEDKNLLGHTNVIVSEDRRKETEFITPENVAETFSGGLLNSVFQKHNSSAPEKVPVEVELQKPCRVTAESSVENSSASLSTSATVGSASDKTMPTGLPPHLMQAYLQYLSQTATGNSGPMGGLLPGLGVGMPVMNPFANPLGTPFMPFGMNPLMMNPLFSLPLQTQQHTLEQLAHGQNDTSVKASQSSQNSSLEMKQKNEDCNKAVRNEIEHSSHHTTNKSKDIDHENVLPLLRNLEIQAEKVIGKQSVSENSKSLLDQNQYTALNERGIKAGQGIEDSVINSTCSQSESNTGISEDKISNETDYLRVRRPSKGQSASLRIPREPSVSSRLYGAQSSPVTDDPAVVRMSSAEISNIPQPVDKNRSEKATSLDGDPSVVRFEQKSNGILSPEHQYPNRSNRAVTVSGNKPQQLNFETREKWMGNGPDLLQVIQNSFIEGQSQYPSADKKHEVHDINSELKQTAVKHNNSSLVHATPVLHGEQMLPRTISKSNDNKTETSQYTKGRGGFGTPSNPKKPLAVEGQVYTSRVAQNPLRSGFNTKSLSERFGGLQNGAGDGYSARKLPPRLQAQREKNQQVRDIITQLRKETEASEQGPTATGQPRSG